LSYSTRASALHGTTEDSVRDGAVVPLERFRFTIASLKLCSQFAIRVLALLFAFQLVTDSFRDLAISVQTISTAAAAY
jgi:hypothetical protein